MKNVRFFAINKMSKVVLLLTLTLLLTMSFTAKAYAATNFTFTHDVWGVPIPSPDAYRVTAFILGTDLGVGHFSTPQDLFVWNNLLYVVDTGNNRIVVVEIHDDGTHTVYGVVDHAIMDGARTTFNGPHGIFVASWGDRWIADTYNHRILHVDANWHVIREIGHPEGSLLDEELDFLPRKLAVDFTGRMFLQASHVNRGLMEFDSNGVFVGYMGASPVSVSFIDQFWRWIATQEQRERMLLHVPTEYNNLTIDRENFIFVTNASADGEPVRRLNAMGADIMIRNGLTYPIGDLFYNEEGVRPGPSRFIDVVALPNDTFVTFDVTRGRLFAYDFQGNLLYAFGGVGNREGHFLLPSALVNKEYTLFALDAQTGAITRFDLTEYGRLINEALAYYRRGNYEASAEAWQEVLRLNGNFGMAYVGIARAYLRQGYYREAMRYFRIQHDRIGYGRAFSFYRRQWMEENFWIFATIIGMLMIVPPVVRYVLRIRREIREA